MLVDHQTSVGGSFKQSKATHTQRGFLGTEVQSPLANMTF